jgi:hypothetical protein
MNIKKIIKEYFTILKKEDIESLSSILNVKSILYTPLDGKIIGRENIKNYILKQKEWLNTKKAKVEVINYIDNTNRVVIELVTYLKKDSKEIELPIVAVLDIKNYFISSIRIYHSTWPLTGKHNKIKPILDPEDHLDEPEIISLYLEGIKNADKEFVLSLFEDRAYIQEPNGSKFRHHGKAELEKFYNIALDKGGVPLKHCTSTFDGKHLAVEYVFDEWGDKKFEPQAGIAIYEIGESGKIAAVRIYNDSSPLK